MFQIVNRLSLNFYHFRSIATSAKLNFNVTVLGAAGGVGQALSLLLKTDPLVSGLSLYDQKNTKGIATDISHIDTNCTVKSFSGTDKLNEALGCADLVICAAGIPRKGDQSDKDLFLANAKLMEDVVDGYTSICPKAFLQIITAPINSVIPYVVELLKIKEIYDPKKVFGICELDVFRARTFIAEFLNRDPQKVSCEVVGGRSGQTVVPIISHAIPFIEAPNRELEPIYQRVRNGDILVTQAKGVVQLAMALASARFSSNLLKALYNVQGVQETAFIESPILPGVKFCASKFRLDPNGIKKIAPLPAMSLYEEKMLDESIEVLRKDIELGVQYADKKKSNMGPDKTSTIVKVDK